MEIIWKLYGNYMRPELRNEPHRSLLYGSRTEQCAAHVLLVYDETRNVRPSTQSVGAAWTGEQFWDSAQLSAQSPRVLVSAHGLVAGNWDSAKQPTRSRFASSFIEYLPLPASPACTDSQQIYTNSDQILSSMPELSFKYNHTLRSWSVGKHLFGLNVIFSHNFFQSFQVVSTN